MGRPPLTPEWQAGGRLTDFILTGIVLPVLKDYNQL